ncbi:MAG: hypothetical protein HKN60_06630 [Rhizobiales bacterium]|nr:hypothetical protein [Hyphomicrobiales bacterium]
MGIESFSPAPCARGFSFERQKILHFISRVGTLDQCDDIRACENMGEMETLRAGHDADPDGHKFLEATTGLIAHQESKIMSPANFSPLK